MVGKGLLLMAGLLFAAMAQAVCYRDGKAYSTGTVVGNYTCQANGTWKKN
jgi:hypothetical protein